MKSQIFLPIILLAGWIIASSSAHSEDVIYQTSFETSDFPTGPLVDDASWRNLSSGSGASVEIVTTDNPEGVSPVEGGQQLRLLRPTSQDNPYARLAFLPLSNGLLEPFDVSFKIAVNPQSPNFVAQAIIADTSTGSAGALVGLSFRDGDGKKSLIAYGIDKSEYRQIETSSGTALEPSTYYEFRVHVDPSTRKYSVELKKDGEVVGALKDLVIKGAIERFNAFGIRMAGGTKNEVLFLDDLKIMRP